VRRSAGRNVLGFHFAQVGPAFHYWALARIPLGDEERLRLEREELDAKGFVPNLERLLLAADDSANGKFAWRLAGLIGGSGATAITVLDLRNGTSRQTSDHLEQGHEEVVKSAAETVMTLEAHPEEVKQGSVEITTRSKKASAPELDFGRFRRREREHFPCAARYGTEFL
jgi:hypothetical protein